MRSIRHHIQLRLLPGFLLLWIGAGGALYFSVKQRYEVELDADLRELWAALPFGNQPNYPGMVTIDDFAKDDFGIYFQVWNQNGDRILKSDNLGRLDLPKAELFGENPLYQNILLENGDPVRTLSVGVTGLGALGNINIVVAKTREKAIASERRILLAIFGIGSMTGVIFTWLLGYSIRSGLKPLELIGNKATRIDGESLSERFPDEGLPVEVKPIVARLNDLMVRLETSFSREKRFSADLAHELRTPVAALRSIVEVALKWPEQATLENYEDIEVISRELQTTIENLLTLARLEKDAGQRKLAEIALGGLIQSAWEPFAEKAAARSLRFQNRIDPKKTIKTDPNLFQLILTNLFSNAVSYAPSGTEIELYHDDDSILILKNQAEHLNKADVEKMFDRLWRHDLARSDSSHSGLGLSIAKTSAEVLSLILEAGLKDKSILFTLHSTEAAPLEKGL